MLYTFVTIINQMVTVMDKRKSILNITVSVGFKILTMLLAIVVKRFLISICGNDINGLNALYLSVIGFLSVAELGVGSAITFCMYKPIVSGDNDTVSALYHLFRRVYLLVGGVILAGGLAITPFIGHLAKDYHAAYVNMPLTFLLMLVSVVLTYLFSCKTSLINAYKNNYITTAITSGGLVLQNVLQIVVLLLTRSFVWYLVCRIVAVCVQWAVTEVITRRRHRVVLSNRSKLSPPVKVELLKNIKAMFMHSIGYTLVNTVDGVVISTFVSVSALGMFSNYTLVLTSLSEVLKLIFTSLTSVIGHLYVESGKTSTRKYSEAFHLLNFVLGTVFFLGYYAVIDSLIAIVFFEELMVARTISVVITMNGFIQFMRQSALVFRQATGTFYHDRYKPLVEGGFNLVLSLLFVQWFGVAGVLVATICTNLFICHVVEPYVLYKYAFDASPKGYYWHNYGRILLFAGALWVLDRCMWHGGNKWTEFLVNGCLSVAFSVSLCAVVMWLNRDLCRHLFEKLRQELKRKHA